MSFPTHHAVNVNTGFLLKKVAAASFEVFSKLMAAHGLHPMHYGMLLMLEAEEPISQHELAERTGIDPSSMVARMALLEDQKLIERTRRAEDRREYEIRLSSKGTKLLTKLRKEADEHRDRFFAPLSKAERKQFHEMLAKLADNLDAGDTEC